MASEDLLTPQAVLSAELPVLRGCGLSERKAQYLRELASHFSDGRLSDELLQRELRPRHSSHQPVTHALLTSSLLISAWKGGCHAAGSLRCDFGIKGLDQPELQAALTAVDSAAATKALLNQPAANEWR